MKFRKYIQEEYFGMVRPWDLADPISVFRNPSNKEWNEVKKASFGTAMRGFINPKTKDLFIWPGAGLHKIVHKNLKLKAKMMRFIVGNTQKKLWVWIDEGPYWKKGDVSIIQKLLARYIPNIGKWEVEVG